jgi:hypothetical protein
MSEGARFTISAFVSKNERPAIELAAGFLSRALGEAGVPSTCSCKFCDGIEALEAETCATMIVSLLPEIESSAQDWSPVEQRLRGACARLAEKGTPIFICTVLRHVEREENIERVQAVRNRIRQLNLLAAEISRETGAFVIDLDRVLADIGARRLQTDYRLAGQAASEMAAHVISLVLLDNATDEFASFEIQGAAREKLLGLRPAVAQDDAVKRELTLRHELRSIGDGRRKQTVRPVFYEDRDAYADWFLGQVASGKIGPREILSRFGQAVRQHGLVGGMKLVVSALSRQLRRKKSQT